MRQLRSAQVTQGVERAPARSLFYAMGYTKEELDRPLIGVVSAHSEIVPGHFNLDKITEAVKAGVRMAGGTHMHDLNNAGGVQAVIAELSKKGLIDTSLITANGRTVGGRIFFSNIR